MNAKFFSFLLVVILGYGSDLLPPLHRMEIAHTMDRICQLFALLWDIVPLINDFILLFDLEQ